MAAQGRFLPREGGTVEQRLKVAPSGPMSTYNMPSAATDITSVQQYFENDDSIPDHPRPTILSCEH